MKKRVAIIGSQGVPAKYGGFETLVENIISRHKPEEVEYTVFCSAPDMDMTATEYKGAHLRYVNLRAHGKMSVPYDIISMIKALRGYDTILLLGVSGGIFVPLYRMLAWKKRVIVNIDGLEHTRKKWGTLAQKFLKFSLSSCIRFAHEIISDNKGIQDYVLSEYGRKPRLIAYGGDHAIRDVSYDRAEGILKYYGLESGKYDLSICRIEPENNCHLTLKAHSGYYTPLVFIGNWNHSDYSRDLYKKYSKHAGYYLFDSIYDLDILYALRVNARYYIHGHRAGGTNPSLVEAMFAGRPILAFDVVYNRETLQNTGYYFKNEEELRELLGRDGLEGKESQAAAHKDYRWQSISSLYEQIF